MRGQNLIIEDCDIGEGTVIWHFCNLYRATIGKLCNIGSFVEIGEAIIGDRCRIGAHSFIPKGVTLEEAVFVGPGVVFTNDRHPSVISIEEGTPKLEETLVKRYASIGANATILCGLTIGEGALIGAGAVVVDDVPDYFVVFGNPAFERWRRTL